MPTQSWYAVSIGCPECQSDTHLQFVLYSADGELAFHFRCDACRDTVVYRVFGQALAHRALMNDLAKAFAQKDARKAKGVLVPPVTQTESLSTDDMKLLKEFHIEPEDGSLQ